ncbi:MAG: hypothetical protein Kow0010_22040 [Dehalococcoidia bacterium]
MSEQDPGAFEGFPGIGKATAIPNVFFARVLPQMRSADELLAFLWASRVTQERKGDERFVSADELWATPGVADTFEALGSGRDGLARGLARCVRLGALLAVRLNGVGRQEVVYLVNNPASRRLVMQARAGAVTLRPGTTAAPVVQGRRPDIFRLYEEHIGTITPMVGEQLVEASERYPADWIEDAFREAAELNARNWRYVDRVLKRWAEEGREHETPGRDSLEARKRRYLGGNAGRAAGRP